MSVNPSARRWAAARRSPVAPSALLVSPVLMSRTLRGGRQTRVRPGLQAAKIPASVGAELSRLACPPVTHRGLACRLVLASVSTFALEGVRSHQVTVEVDVRRGLPAFTLVGLPDRAVRESRERVRAAVQNSRLDFPMKRLTVNLAPAHVRKAGPGFDLAIAVGLLAASGQVPHEALVSTAVCGELSLSGELRPVRGTLAAAMGAREAGCERMLVPHQNAVRGDPGRGPEGDRSRRSPGDRRLLQRRGRARSDTRRRRAHRGPRDERPRPARRPGAGGREAGARDRRGRRPQPPHGRAARGGQDDARPAPPGDPARAGSRRGARDHPDAQRGRPRAPGRSCASAPSAPRTTRSRRRASSVEEASLARARSRSLTAESCSSTSWPSSRGWRSTLSGNRSRRDGSTSCAASARSSSPPTRCWSRPATAVPVDGGRSAAAARSRPGPLPAAAEPSAARPARSGLRGPGRAAARARRRRPQGPSSAAVRKRVMAARERQSKRLEGTAALCNGDMDGRLTRRWVSVDGDAVARLIAARESAHLSGRGHDRVLRVARTDRRSRRPGSGARPRRRGGAHVPPRRLGAAGGMSDSAEACGACLRRSQAAGAPGAAHHRHARTPGARARPARPE